MKPINKVNKKAWQQIQIISNASNMIEVNTAINNAILDTFGLRNLGLLKIRLKDQDVFNKIKNFRQNNLFIHSNEVKNYLITFIPDRLKKSHLYVDLVK